MTDGEKFSQALANVEALTPRPIKDSKGKVTKFIAHPSYTRQVVTVVGVKRTASRFLPVSHPGYSNETYVDKLDLLGKTRAEFIARKLKGIERRAHMAMFREMVEAETNNGWERFFAEKFLKSCSIPDQLCIACWNCSLFGGLEAGRGATFSRIRYFDTFSVEDAAECVQTDDSPEQMAIGNTVGEDLSVERGEASFHRYEYVKAGTRFPFITIIESPTLLDVVGYLAAVKLADQHGYGKYSANHGKFETKFLAVSTGYPLFSVLDLLTWFENNAVVGTNDKTVDHKKGQGDPPPKKPQGNITDRLKFEAPTGQPTSLFDDSIVEVQKKLTEEFKGYLAALGAAHPGAEKKPKEKRPK
jgi:CRISPR type I-D-associated protein Csc2